MPLPDVSRRHCRFVYSAAGWEVIDLGSLNGVYVNGARVQRSLIQVGDLIRIGGMDLDVETPHEDVAGLSPLDVTVPINPQQRKAS